jgi:hypothetical protein
MIEDIAPNVVIAGKRDKNEPEFSALWCVTNRDRGILPYPRKNRAKGIKSRPQAKTVGIGFQSGAMAKTIVIPNKQRKNPLIRPTKGDIE